MWQTTVSIPQAVSTVATIRPCEKYTTGLKIVSIPQAVSTVATGSQFEAQSLNDRYKVSIPQAVSTVATAGPRKPVFMGPKIRF